MKASDSTSLAVRRTVLIITLLGFVFLNMAEAWDDKTHIAIAYIAYRKLNRHTRDRLDEILVLHPLYAQWTKGAKLGQAGLLAFVNAATWPNCIQTTKCPGYTEDGTENGFLPTAGQEEWQNIGFADKLMHKYWHFIQRPDGNGLPTGEIPQPNIETQLQILTDALNSNAIDALKAYDVAWVANLIGELHQPLNCISRFSAQHPNGDLNGREVKVQDTAADNLHGYWDDLLGAEQDLESAMKEAKTLASMQDENGLWDAVDFEKWINESFEVAKKSVYTPSVTSQEAAGNAVVLDAAYRKNAIDVAVRQVTLAGNRLASLLNKNLK